MQENPRPFCPECEDPRELEALHRRGFLRAVGTSTASLLALGGTASIAVGADETKTKAEKAPKPAEGLVKELFASLSDDQKKAVALPYDYGVVKGKGTPARLRTYNAAIGNTTIGKTYAKAQQELIERILKAIC